MLDSLTCGFVEAMHRRRAIPRGSGTAAAGCLASEVLFVGDNWSCVLLVATAEKDAAEDGS